DVLDRDRDGKARPGQMENKREVSLPVGPGYLDRLSEA
ncbi:MAG: hypothetical protein JWP34_5408, partial [Massilia sp.]|nr:hypothetical protein [Massilia sp.]